MKEYFDKLYTGKYQEFIVKLEKSIKEEEKKFIITANPETFMMGRKHPIFDEVLKKPYITIVPDGIGIVKAANILGMRLESRITGVEICEELFSILNREKRSLYLFGAKKEVLETLCKVITEKYQDIKLLGCSDGYIDDKDKVMEEAALAKPDVLLVALGIPNQEVLIDKYYDEFEKGILIGVGGSFDVLSGIKKRAPKIFIKCNLEWLYRIFKEPKRIKRFYISNVKFIKEVYALKKGKHYEN